MHLSLTKHIKLFSFFLLFNLAFAAISQAQILYDNGPYFNSVGTGSGGADESVLYTTTFGMGTIGFGHQSNLFNRVADDFTISNCFWRVDSIVFFGYQTGSTTTSTFTGVNFRIWDSIPDAIGSAVVFGDTTTNRMTRTAWSGTYRITETTTGNTQRPIMRNVCALNGVVLSGGTYWIDWASLGSLASGPWAPPRTPVGVAVTGNGRQRIGSTWNNLVDGGTGTPAQGLPFIIYGAVLDPVVDAGPDQNICAGGSVTLGGSPSGSGGQGTLSFLWNNGGTLNDSLATNPIASPGSTTSYILAVTDTAGCTVMDTTLVTVGTVSSSFLIGDTSICPSSTILLDAGAGASYVWNTGDTTQTITVGSGTYSVSVDNGFGCFSVDTVVVSTAAGVTIIGNGSFCQQSGDTLTANIAPGTYQWSTGETTQVIVVTQPGTYSVTVVDSLGCTSSDDFTVVQIPSPTASFSFTVGGAGLTYSFTDLSTGSPTTYAWNFGDGGVDSTANPSHTYAASGSYTVTLIVTNACGADTFTQSVTVVGIEGSLAGAMIGVSPNPAHGSFAFQVNGMAFGDLHVEMLDLQGRVCNSWQYDEAINGISQGVDASNLAKGVYFLRFRSGNMLEMRKVVLE